MAQQISREEWERKYGRGRMERPQPVNIPGLPAADEVLAELAYIRQLQDAQPPVDPGRLVRTQLPQGTRFEGRALDEEALQLQVAKELTRQKLLQAADADASPAALLSAAVGRPVGPETAELARAYLDLPGGEPLSPAEAVALAEQSGLRRALELAQRGGGRPVLAQQPTDLGRLAQIVSQKGEIGPDEGLQRTLLAAYRGLIDPSQPIEAQIAALSPEESAELALRARSLTQLQQLSQQETAQAAQYLGAGRTIGGRRNQYRKEKSASEEAIALRTPGNVLSAGLEFSQDDMLLPILVAPKNQQVWSQARGGQAPYSAAAGPAMQIAQYFAGKDNLGRSRFAPSLRDARVLYVNPYAELPPTIVERLGLDPVPLPVEKDISGAYDQDALNVPIPDPGEAANVLPPKVDPGYRAAVTPVYRNPTFAEAVNALSLRHRTPIKDFTEDMLVNRGRNYEDALVGRPDISVFALGNKRLPSGEPAPIAAYFEQPADPAAPRVASVRVGSGQKRQVEFYEALDDLVDALAGEVYGRGPVQAEMATAERFRPASASLLPGEVRYGALTNLRSTDPLVSAYQRRLLDEAGFPATGLADNPLLSMVDLMEQLASAPPSDAPLPAGVRAAAAAEPVVAPRGQTGAARLLARAKEPLVRTVSGREPTTERKRQATERAAADLLRRLLNSPTAAQPRPDSRPDAPTGAVRERFKQPLIPGMRDALMQRGFTLDPADDVARYMASRAPDVPASSPERVVQYVPAELYERFWPSQPSPPPAAPLQQSAAAVMRRPVERQLGLGLSLPYSSAGLTPDPADDVARYMARKGQALAPQASLSTPGADQVLPGQPRPADVVQASLGLERLHWQQRNQVVAEQASSIPQTVATQTVENSPLNAPPPPDTSAARQADELLRRYRGRLLG